LRVMLVLVKVEVRKLLSCPPEETLRFGSPR
jgi:hypothetical protein